MDLVSYVSAIKIDANGLCASQAQHVETSFKCYIFIIQATIMVLGSLTERITCTIIKTQA